jgi:cbb3-type cytochrome oxidase subunit 3
MKALAWFVIVACVLGIAVALWLLARKEAKRRRESEARSAALLAEAIEAVRAKSKTPAPGARD